MVSFLLAGVEIGKAKFEENGSKLKSIPSSIDRGR
jgi:hypothetical protein